MYTNSVLFSQKNNMTIIANRILIFVDDFEGDSS